ncbi:MAG: prepilin-type N-terminal cleavage/methylation domain-containing protein [Planctomycetota bacterium]
MYRDIKAKRQQGFTLIEILIVVIILGILAAIVIPQFSSASEDAKSSSLASQLQALRSQVALYRLEHNDKYPTADGSLNTAWNWDKLTGKTDKDGDIDANGQYGPYLQSAAVNPFNQLDVVGIDEALDNTFGFIMDKNGKLFAVGKPAGDGSAQWFNEVTGESSAAAPAGYAAP